MQTHIIERAFKIIEKSLPKNYVKKVQDKSKTEIDSRLIQKIRTRAPKYNLNNYVDIILLLVEVAKENKNKIEKLEKITN